MKILVVCQHYYPEPFRITDICEELVKAGHEVFVVTGLPNYPEGKIYDGYRGGDLRNETLNGVRIHRCFTIGRRRGAFFRFLNYYSYALSSTLYTLAMREEFDLVFVNQLSPVMMARAGIAYKRKYNKKLILYCLDLWPESLMMGGVKKDSALYRFFHNISSKIYHAADQICVSSKSFSNYFSDEFNITNTQYIPQYAEGLFEPQKCYKIPNDTVDLMFAGNVGVAQSVETIIYAAEKTKEIPNLFWHIVGDGSELTRMKQLCTSLKLKNVIFYGRKRIEDMPEYYSRADAMLITMKKNDIISMTLPGKMQTYMAAGKTILGAIDGETADVILESNCGICCPAEDSDGLAAIVVDYIKRKDNEHFSQNSLKYYNMTYSKCAVLSKILDLFEQQVE